MCGIVGVCGQLNGAHVSQVLAMMQSVRHRGPDGSGILALSENNFACTKSAGTLEVDESLLGFQNPSLVFGHLRLAILDLSTDALQPLSSADSRTWIIFNGEIYNYLELRSELVGLGHHFRTQSDTEVILEAYQEWGLRMLDRLDGMFAFAIADSRHRRTICVRDRFGEKPFFYQVKENCLWFASEIKALLADGLTPKANLSALAKYLVNTQINFGSETFFNDIKQLPPSCYMEVKWDEPEKFRINAYYSHQVVCAKNDYSEDFPSQFRELLSQSVRMRLRADVPVGTCLSGGLDSSAVASLALHYLNDSGPEFHAFIAVPDIPGFSELEWAKMVVLGKHAVLHEVRVSAEDVKRHLDDFLRYQDEPVPSLSMLMQYRVMQTARENDIPVLLDGQGGDEVLLGYERLYAVYIFQLLKEGKFDKAWQEFHQYSEHGLISKRRLLGLVAYASPPVRNIWRSRNRIRWLLPEIQHLVGRESERYASIDEAQEYEIWTQPLPALLRFEDRNAMRFAVETRLPFLNHKLVEFCAQAPVDMKLHNGWTKWMLRQSMDGMMPSKIAWRRDKKGFASPDRVWLQGLTQQTQDALGNSPRSALLYNKKPLEVYNLVSGRNPGLAWRVFCLEKWMQLNQVSI